MKITDFLPKDKQETSTIEIKPSKIFIENLKELLGYQEFFLLRKATELGKSGTSVKVVLSHLAEEHILSNGKEQIEEARKNKDKIISNLAFMFHFACSTTNYFTPTKISHILHFKKLETKPLKYSELYSEFKDFVKETFKESEFKILQYKQINNTLHIVFEHPLPYHTLFPDKLMNDVRSQFLPSYFITLKKRFLFNSSRIKEVISEEGIFFIYRIELLRRKYNFTEIGICKESKHLLIKYIKMLSLASDNLMRYHHWSNCFVYLELGNSSPSFPLRSIYHQIKEEVKFSPYLFLGRDKVELSNGDLWVPRKRELEDLVFGDILDRQNVRFLRYSKYQEWREKSKISIKCEELNLLAYYMETEHDLIWNKQKHKWSPKPILPQKVFKINDYLTLKLEGNYTNIYVKEKLFNHCKYLLFSFSKDELSEYEEIDSIDEVKEKYDSTHESDKSGIPPEVEFWGHCSNLQTWYENNYDTRILHSNIAFPLLEKLSKCGDPLALRVFKEEIALRFESNHESVIRFLLNEKYLKSLELDEIEVLSKNLDLMKWSEESFYNFCGQWISKASETSNEKENQVRLRLIDLSLKRMIRLNKEIEKHVRIEE